MKALVKRERGPGIWMEEVEPPTISETEVLIKIKKVSICGTDIHIYKWDEWAQATVPVPLVIGHEFVGTVAAVGRQVKKFKVGDRVSGEGHLTCGTCRNCLSGKRHLCPATRGVGYHVQGCFADYFALPETNAFLLPDYISDDLAAIFDPLGNATHTALSFDLVGEDILITGAGPIGIMAACIAKQAGARHVVITDVNPYRLELAKSLGIVNAINIQNESIYDLMKKLGMNGGFDVILEMSGSPKALETVLDVAYHGAHIGLLGLLPTNTGIDWNKVIFKSLHLKGIYGREIFNTWFKMAYMMESGLDVSGLVTHHFDAKDYQEAFETMASGQSGKIILNWE